MININLRQWRDELRAEQQKQFIAVMLFTALISFALIYGWLSVVNNQILLQDQRNSHLETETKALEKKIVEINSLRQEKKALEERMGIIQDLQGDRPIVVHIFDELARITPDGVYLISFDKVNEKINLTGHSDNVNLISDFLRSLDNSAYFTNPNMPETTKTIDANGDYLYDVFTITVTQTKPEDAEGDEK